MENLTLCGYSLSLSLSLSLPISFCPAGYPVYNAYYGRGRGPIFLENVDCSGDEERLIDCEHNGISVHDCYHYQDAGVYCSPRGIIPNNAH